MIFSSTNDFRAREIIKLYSRRMQIEQNFRDEKNGRFGFGLRASKKSFNRKNSGSESAGNVEHYRNVVTRLSR
ncbi:putative transposase [Shigella boydii 965-58]|nr:putative transposase [Shigella boydii 965-58]